MKLLVVLCALIALVSADVSHLNNMYLPPNSAPHHHHHQHEAAEHVEQVAEIPEPSPVASFDAPLQAESPSHIEDPVAHHVAFAAKLSAEQPIIMEIAHKTQEHFAAASKPEEVFAHEEPQEHAQETHDEEEAVPEPAPVQAEFAAPNAEYDIPALPEVSNGIDTRYGANGGYVY